MGESWKRGRCLTQLARLLFLSGRDTAAARSLTEQSLSLMQEIDKPWERAYPLVLLGQISLQQDDQAQAGDLFEESFLILQRIQYKELIPSCLEGLAAVATEQGELVWAAYLWGAAEALCEAIGTPIPPVYRLDHERAVAKARAQVGNEAFAKAWAEGRTITPEQAMTKQS
jgi:hypothetical protein